MPRKAKRPEREGPLRVPLPFDDALKAALEAQPPEKPPRKRRAKKKSKQRD